MMPDFRPDELRVRHEGRYPRVVVEGTKILFKLLDVETGRDMACEISPLQAQIMQLDLIKALLARR